MRNNQNKQPEISVVIPVYNEAEHIIDSLKEISSYVKKSVRDYELIVIDDGSTDATWAKLIQAANEIPGLYNVQLSRNFGKEYALCAGLEKASGQAVIIMDADLQHPPSLIPEIVDLWKRKDVDVVECTKRKRGKESLKNRLGAKLFYGIIQSLTGYNLQGASDYKLLDKKVIQAWLQMPERTTFFRGMTAWLGFNKETIEFDVSPRTNGETKWSLRNLIKLAMSAVVSFTSLPLRIVTLAGVAFFSIAILLGIQTLYHKLIGTAVTGFTTVILLLLIIGSVIMISLGIIGEYIAAIYNEVKGRPRYLIQDTVKSRSVGAYYDSSQQERDLA
jgi:polyisoprenyl-phosphate glycosyltransferase